MNDSEGSSDGRTAAERPSLRAERPPLGRRADTDQPAPLSHAQQSLWFMHRLVPNQPFYNLASALSLRGPLDVAAVRSTFTVLVARHEALRTVFPARDGEPVQQVLPAMPVSVPVIDAQGDTVEARRAHAQAMAVDDGQR
ncbi:MAG: condensation domain-containing protein, partial [Acidobacteriota bacterium]